MRHWNSRGKLRSVAHSQAAHQAAREETVDRRFRVDAQLCFAGADCVRVWGAVGVDLVLMPMELWRLRLGDLELDGRDSGLFMCDVLSRV